MASKRWRTRERWTRSVTESPRRTVCRSPARSSTLMFYIPAPTEFYTVAIDAMAPFGWFTVMASVVSK